MQQKKIGILYITYDGLCDPLGQSQVTPYIKGLANKGINIFILSFEKRRSFEKLNLIKELKFELNQYHVGWRHLRYHNNPRIFAAVYDVLCGLLNGFILIKKYRLNIVHARGYVSGFIASWLKRLLKIKFIFDMRGFWIEEKVDAGFWRKDSISYKIAKNMEKSMLSLAERVIVLTEKAKLFLESCAVKSEKQIAVIPTYVDLKMFSPLKESKKDFLQNKVVILYSGSIGTFYAFKEMVEFFKIFREKEENAFFLALINNEQQAAEDVLKSHGIGKESYKVLALSHLEVPEWLREADVSLMFYRRNNSYAGCCPTKFAESLACGVPVIINKDIGDCDEIVRKEGVGFVAEDFQEPTFRKISDDFLSFRKERGKGNIDIRCRSVAENLFSLETGIKRYLELYNKLI